MLQRVRSRIRRRQERRSPILLVLLLLAWSILLGWGMALALAAAEPPIAQGIPVALGTVDPVPERYQSGLKVYLEDCGSCHLALPPEVLPSETWRTLLLEPQQHYGERLQQIPRPFIFMVWDYLQTFSRPLGQGEKIPFRVAESRYFKALHPRVDLPRPLNARSCVTCHPGAADYDFRRLTPEWQDVL